jgi:hypothetical protein
MLLVFIVGYPKLYTVDLYERYNRQLDRFVSMSVFAFKVSPMFHKLVLSVPWFCTH